jgi:hypothetical protein
VVHCGAQYDERELAHHALRQAVVGNGCTTDDLGEKRRRRVLTSAKPRLPMTRIKRMSTT